MINESLTTWLIDFHLGSTALLALVLLAGALFRQPARRIVLAWGACGAIAALAVLLALPGWSLIHLTATPEPIAATQPAAVPAGFPVAAPAPMAALPPMPPIEAQPVVETPAPPPAPTEATAPALRLADVAPWLLPVGGLAVLGWIALGWAASLRLIASANPAGAALESMLAGMTTGRAPRLLVTGKLSTPVALGVLAPSILLPKQLESEDAEQLRSLLAHELAHIRHGDLWLLTMTRVLLVMLWPNPLFWLLRRRIRLDQELLADTAAAEVTCREQYAEQLVGWARESAGARPPRLTTAVGLWEGPSQLRRRVATLLDEGFTVLRSTTRRWRATTLALTIAAATAISLVTVSPAALKQAEAVEAPAEAANPVKDFSPTPDLGDQYYNHPITVSGRTLDKAGKPLPGVKVYLATRMQRSRLMGQAVTDQNGRYEFKEAQLNIRRADTRTGHDHGRFIVYANADGRGFTWCRDKSYYPQKEAKRTRHYGEDKDSPTRYFADDKIELDLKFTGAAKAAGVVVDNLGEPIPNTDLTIWDAERVLTEADLDRRGDVIIVDDFAILNSAVPKSIKTVRTDSQGRFEYANLPKGCLFRLKVNPPGFPDRMVWFSTAKNGAVKHESGKIYSAGQSIRLEFTRPNQVVVQVLHADTGKPAAKAFVNLYNKHASAVATSNEKGIAKLSVPPGDYKLNMLPRYRTPYLESETEVTIKASGDRKLTAKLPAAAKVRIKVVDLDTGKGLPGVDLWIKKGPNHHALHYVSSYEVETHIVHRDRPRTDAGGVIDALFEPGTHTIGVGQSAYPEGYLYGDREGEVIECQAGQVSEVEFRLKKKTPVAIKEAPSKAPAAKKLPEPLTYSGVVVNKRTGEPIRGAKVLIRLKTSSKYPWPTLDESTYPSDANGRYQFTIPGTLVADPYLYVEVEAQHANFARKSPSGYALGMIRKNQKMGEEPFFSKISMQPAEAVSGKLLRPDGKPAAGVNVLLYSKADPKDLQEYGSFDSTETDAQGAFKINRIAAGPAVLWFRPTDLAPETHILKAGNADLTTDAANEDGAHPPRPHHGDLGSFTLGSGVRLKGRVVGLDGSPLTGVWVNAELQSGPAKKQIELPVADVIERSALTDNEGRFSMAPLPPGVYRVAPDERPGENIDRTRKLRPLPEPFLPREVELTQESPNPSVELKASRPVVIQAQNVTSKGNPTKGHGFMMHGWAGENHKLFYSAHVEPDSQGVSRLTLPAGLHDVGLQFTTNEHGSLRIRLKPGDPLGNKTEFKLGTLTNHVDQIQVVKYKAPILLVTVVDKGGSKVADFKCVIKYTKPDRPRERTGTFFFGGKGDVSFEPQQDDRWRTSQLLPDEPFELIVNAPGFKEAKSSYQLKESETQEVTITLEAE